MSLKSTVRRISSSRWTAEAIAVLAGFAYLVQAVIYAHSQESILDEGAYLYKGYLFATGRYTPYQEYGPWSNHMPLSFLIPGAVQVLIEPGLRTARYFAIFLGLLMLVGLWVLVKRLGGRWWAAAAIGVVALSPAMIKTYSIALSQGLVACMMVWTVALVLGEQRSTMQILLGSFLAGLMVVTRENMAPVLPLLVLFVLWRHGFRTSALAALAGGFPIVITYAIYWPGILQLSSAIFPFLDVGRAGEIGIGVWYNSLPFSDRWQSFLLGLRANFIPMAGAIGLSLLWIWAGQWKTEFHRQAAAFLSVLFIGMLILHGWAALGLNYCVYCFEGYLTFFAPLGLALIAVTYTGWKTDNMRWFSWYTSILMILLMTSVAYSAYQEIGPSLLSLPFPRLKAGQILSGTAPIGSILENAFGFDYKLARFWVSTLSGLMLSLFILLIVWLIFRTKQSRSKLGGGKGFLTMSILLVTGLFLSPTVVLGGAKQDRDCGLDVIASYESVGKHLSRFIQPGRLVFWEGGLTVIPLLYLPGIKIFPAQINNGYSHRIGGNEDELARLGLWNDEMKNRWLEEADFILIEKPRYNEKWKDFVEAGQFEELPPSPSYLPCEDRPLRIFRRIAD